MSAKQRRDAETLRRKYARIYEVPVETVRVTYLDDEDAAVFAPGLPTWTLGVSAPAWAIDPRVRTFR